LQDRVVSQVVRVTERLRRAEQRLNIYEAGLFDEQKRPNGAVYRSIGLNFYRIRGTAGIPLEVLDSIIRLNDVLLGYADSLSDYDRERYRLLLALGLPPAGLLDPSCLPLPPAPPPHPPAVASAANRPVPAAPPTSPRGDGRRVGRAEANPAGNPLATALPPVLTSLSSTAPALPAASRSFLDTLLHPIAQAPAPLAPAAPFAFHGYQGQGAATPTPPAALRPGGLLAPSQDTFSAAGLPFQVVPLPPR
jgi:hypothetical protein